MDGWNTSFLLGWPIFRCYVSFREGRSVTKKPNPLRDVSNHPAGSTKGHHPLKPGFLWCEIITPDKPTRNSFTVWKQGSTKMIHKMIRSFTMESEKNTLGSFEKSSTKPKPVFGVPSLFSGIFLISLKHWRKFTETNFTNTLYSLPNKPPSPFEEETTGCWSTPK